MSETSMSMSLAEGIIKRDLRVLGNKQYELFEILEMLDTHNVRMMSGKTKIKYTEMLLKDFKGLWSQRVKHGKVDKYSYDVWIIRDTKAIDHGILKIHKHGASYSHRLFGLSYHAMARCVYREQLNNIKEMLELCSAVCFNYDLIVGQILTSPVPIERYAQVKNGFLIIKRFDDGCCRAVTYVDYSKASKEQMQENANVYQILLGLAESINMSPVEYIKRYVIKLKAGQTASPQLKAWRNGLINEGVVDYDDDDLAAHVLKQLENDYGVKEDAESCN